MIESLKCKECGFQNRACIISFDIENPFGHHERAYLLQCDRCHTFTLPTWEDAWTSADQPEYWYDSGPYTPEEAETIFLLFTACRHYKDCDCEIHQAVSGWLTGVNRPSIFDRIDLIQKLKSDPRYPDVKKEWHKVMRAGAFGTKGEGPTFEEAFIEADRRHRLSATNPQQPAGGGSDETDEESVESIRRWIRAVRLLWALTIFGLVLTLGFRGFGPALGETETFLALLLQRSLWTVLFLLLAASLTVTFVTLTEMAAWGIPWVTVLTRKGLRQPAERRRSPALARQGGRAYWAYEFVCDRPIEDILAILNASGPWTWSLRESHWYGDYLNCRPVEGVRVRIHEWSNNPFAAREREGPGLLYTGLLEIKPDSHAERSSIDGIFRELLGKLSAQNIVETEPYD